MWSVCGGHSFPSQMGKEVVLYIGENENEKSRCLDRVPYDGVPNLRGFRAFLEGFEDNPIIPWPFDFWDSKLKMRIPAVVEQWKSLESHGHVVTVIRSLGGQSMAGERFMPATTVEFNSEGDKDEQIPSSSERYSQEEISCLKLEPKYKVFLSHSEAQKVFVEKLYDDLELLNHPAFSHPAEALPKGANFPAFILDAAKKCRVFVVVLSEEYITSIWPMLELTECVRAMKSDNPGVRLLPLFYKVSVAYLSDVKWRSRWERIFVDKRLNLEVLAEVVRELCSMNGLHFGVVLGRSEVEYRQAIVRAIRWHLISKKILLCGRTGSGKSTVANMLIEGHLNPPHLFPTSSGVRGKTLDFQREEINEGFVVVDTVGFGEAQHGSVTDKEARNMLYDFFVKISKDSYHYFVYVHKWGKIDTLDCQLWDFFKQAFVGAENNFVIVFTHCSKPRDLEDNIEAIRVSFRGCERYIVVDFPPANKPGTSASAKAKRNDNLRTDSLMRLKYSLEVYNLPARKNLCLRSNLKKGRILLMGSDTRARNMVAELLVNGSLNMTASASSSGSDSSTIDSSTIHGNETSKCAFFKELEGRRWQVVNALVFDKEGIGDIHADFLTKDDARMAARKAVTMLAYEFITILHHGNYSHFIHVEDRGNRPVEWESVLQEITKVLHKKDWINRSVALIVNSNDDNIPLEVSDRFKKWERVCGVQLPKICECPDMERENQVIRQGDLDMIEEALDAIVPYAAWGLENYTELLVDPNAFEALVCASQQLQETEGEIDFSEKFGALDLGLKHIRFETSTRHGTTATIFRSHVKRVVAEIKCNENSRALFIGITGKIKPFREGLCHDFVWGELQVVDKHHADRKLRRLPLSIGNSVADVGYNTCPSTYREVTAANDDQYEDLWCIGHDTYGGKEFFKELSEDDTVVLWMNRNPNPLELDVDKFSIYLSWR